MTGGNGGKDGLCPICQYPLAEDELDPGTVYCRSCGYEEIRAGLVDLRRVAI